ncbi:MAG: glycosyltransferase family 2 protein [Rhodocyclaceae bacterium]|nr:glycosyltransferase family 2 protein [Rhodocyclaceae bacterium]
MPSAPPPLVSIIVPVYNAVSTLSRAVDSILAQDFGQFELILSDDGSTDDSCAQCDRYATSDERVRVVHAANAGPSAARNRAIAVCRGEFLFFLDADDSLAPQALSSLLASQRSNNADIVVGDFTRRQGDLCSPSGHSLAFSSDTALDRQALRRYVCDLYLKTPNRYHLLVYVWGRLIRTALVRTHQLTFNEALHTSEDVAFNFGLLPQVDRLNFVNTPILYKYIDKHDGHAIGKRLTGESGWKHFGYVEAFHQIAAYLDSSDVPGEHTQQLNVAFVIYTVIMLIRLCGHANRDNWRDILSLVQRILGDERLVDGLRLYRPARGNSQLIPLLLRWRLATPLLLTCAIKSRLLYR